MRCPSCGVDVKREASSCEWCGSTLSRACGRCGAVAGVAARFCETCGATLPALASGGSATSPTPGQDSARTPAPAQVRGERRQTTIMFCDLVDSTVLSNMLDPEDLRDVYRTFRNATTPVIERHQGHVAGFMGDAILAFFGSPRAHEYDAERAVQAALEIVSVVRSLRLGGGMRLDLRIGIATGLVIVGELVGDRAADGQAAVGPTIHLAARLENLAQPGSVIISNETRSLVGGLFECADYGLHRLKGFDEPVHAWRVTGERMVESRFEATHPPSELGRMVGREPQMQLLLDLWRRVCSGHGHIVTVRGEPGIGKSRLMQALREAVPAGPWTLLRYFCSPFFENTAFFPVIGHLERMAGIGRADDAKARLDKLEALVAKTTPPDAMPDTVPYLAALLSIPFEGRYAPLTDSPERRRERTLAVLRARLSSLAANGPVMMLAEDLQWSDPSTLDLIGQVVEYTRSQPIFLMMTVRPEFEPPWKPEPHMTTMELGRLDRDSGTAIVTQTAGGKPLPPEILEQILAKSDGVPLFLEELTKTVLESRWVVEEPDRYALTAPLPTLAVPNTLHESLMARLDRLGAAKEVAQVGAVIGREFQYELLRSVMARSETDLRTALNRLVEADLINPYGSSAQLAYRFKHALLHDAAYATLLRSAKQDLHAEIAVKLQSLFPKTAETAPELLAHHLTEAGQARAAIPHWEQAGMRAAERAAYAETKTHYLKALALLANLPEDAARDQLELRLRGKLGNALSASQGYAAPEVEAAYQRARELCHKLGDTAEAFPAIRGLCTFYIVRCNLDAAREFAEQCIRLGEEAGRVDYQIEGYTALGYIVFYLGQLAESSELLSHAIRLYRDNRGETLAYPSPQDPCVASLCLLSHALCLQGQLGAARRTIAETATLVQRLGRPLEEAYSQGYAAMLKTLMADPAEALQHAERTIALSKQHGLEVWLGIGNVQLAAAKAALGDALSGIQILTGAAQQFGATGARLGSPFIYVWFARMLRMLGQGEQALGMVEQGLAFSEHDGERYMDGDLLLVKGDLLADQGDTFAARDAFLRALQVARNQGARLFELRAALSLCNLGGAQTDCAEGRAQLRSVLLAMGDEAKNCPDAAQAAVALASD
jgi:predicted ATPase/class 3 adenylate cyclase